MVWEPGPSPDGDSSETSDGGGRAGRDGGPRGRSREGKGSDNVVGGLTRDRRFGGGGWCVFGVSRE